MNRNSAAPPTTIRSMTPAGAHIALVTGANRGLGLETSRQLLAKGLRVVLTGRDDRALERAVESLGADGERAMTVRMDVTDVTSITRARRVVSERFGAVDVLVNNAAVLEFENEDALSIPADACLRGFVDQRLCSHRTLWSLRRRWRRHATDAS